MYTPVRCVLSVTLVYLFTFVKEIDKAFNSDYYTPVLYSQYKTASKYFIVQVNYYNKLWKQLKCKALSSIYKHIGLAND